MVRLAVISWKEGEMMRSVVAVESRNEGAKRSRWHGFVFAFVLFALVWSVSGCTHPGESTAETDRRHLRVLRSNQEALLSDIDSVLGFDQPSQLADRRVP
jgi:hypothetical protein